MWELIPCSFLLTGPDGLSELAPPPLSVHRLMKTVLSCLVVLVTASAAVLIPFHYFHYYFLSQVKYVCWLKCTYSKDFSRS